MSLDINEISIVILAGGQARRMDGQNKGLLPLAGRPMLQHVLDRLPREADIIISANADIERYQSFGYPIIEDVLVGDLGPMNGIYSALQATSSEWLLTAPCDIPNLPVDYLDRMISQKSDAKAYVADDGQRMHNGCCLLHASLTADLLAHIKQQKLAMHGFLKSIPAQRVDFSDQVDAFMNINTPQQLQQAERTKETRHD
ncbi:Molybdenum cofactor guanylyltransferase [hydrothermal vent metagenome]|uniref:Molybdenum cofactor guanylyltransferase n=1 Tax=hydrothermal vent metagenome TaxID=652676 RepID=A0A3B1ABE3_9ZZZZ